MCSAGSHYFYRSGQVQRLRGRPDPVRQLELSSAATGAPLWVFIRVIANRKGSHLDREGNEMSSAFALCGDRPARKTSLTKSNRCISLRFRLDLRGRLGAPMAQDDLWGTTTPWPYDTASTTHWVYANQSACLYLIGS